MYVIITFTCMSLNSWYSYTVYDIQFQLKPYGKDISQKRGFGVFDDIGSYFKNSLARIFDKGKYSRTKLYYLK